jgi:GT2 family glycosyltransferase
MDLSIIIVNYNVYEDVNKCIVSIYKYLKDIDFEIIVVDNNSPDRSILDINSVHKDVKLIPLSNNNGFGAANNVGMELAKGKYLFLVNPDILFVNDSISKLYGFLEIDENVGVAGAVQFRPSGKIEYYYTFFPSLYSRLMQEFGLYMSAPLMRNRFLKFWEENIEKGEPFKVDWVIGSCMMLRKAIYDAIGGFDESFFLYEEETEWQYRMSQKGWVSAVVPKARVLHNHHSSAGKFGFIFIYFHEFRSRIIFSNLHDNFLKRFVRKIMILCALMIRIIFNFFRFLITRKKIYKKKILVFFTLLKLDLLPREKIVKNRFQMKDFEWLFAKD